jgi:hypothetical protein
LPEVWDKTNPRRVSQDFLDLLNAESAKMTAALQNPANWGGIMRAAQVLRKRADMQAIDRAGQGGAVSQAEVESLGFGKVDAMPPKVAAQPRVIIETEIEFLWKPEVPKQDPLSRWKRSKFVEWFKSWKVWGE